MAATTPRRRRRSARISWRRIELAWPSWATRSEGLRAAGRVRGGRQSGSDARLARACAHTYAVRPHAYSVRVGSRNNVCAPASKRLRYTRPSAHYSSAIPLDPFRRNASGSCLQPYLLLGPSGGISLTGHFCQRFVPSPPPSKTFGSTRPRVILPPLQKLSAPLPQHLTHAFCITTTHSTTRFCTETLSNAPPYVLSPPLILTRKGDRYSFTPSSCRTSALHTLCSSKLECSTLRAALLGAQCHPDPALRPFR